MTLQSFVCGGTMHAFMSAITLLLVAATAACQDGAPSGPASEQPADAGKGTPSASGSGAASASASSQKAAQVGQVAVSIDGTLSDAFPEGMMVTAFPTAVDPSPGAAAVGTISISTLALLVDLPDCPPPPQALPAGGCKGPENGLPPPQDGTGSMATPMGANGGPGQTGGPNQPGGPETGSAASFDPFAAHPKDRLQNAHDRLTGAASDCFDPSILAALQRDSNQADACFGFDYGIVSGTALGSVDVGQINPALNGKQGEPVSAIRDALVAIPGRQPDAGEEACMVKIGRQSVDGAASRVEGALRLFEGMLCQAKKDKVLSELPAGEASVDMKAAFANFSAGTVSEASLARLADRDGRAVYRSRVVATFGQAKPLQVTLIHSPGKDDNLEYDGVLYTETEGNLSNGDAASVVSSISYTRSGKTQADQRLKMELRTVSLNKSITADVIGNDGKVDYNAGADASGSFGPGMANKYIEGARYFAFDVNPSTYAGAISVWNNPGGDYSESARGFLFESAQNADGTLSGCAYAGAYREGSIRMAIKEGKTLEPTGCFTPLLRTAACNPTDNVGTKIWKQCFVQQGTGYYVVDAAKTASADGFDSVDLQVGKPTLPKPAIEAVGEVGGVAD